MNILLGLVLIFVAVGFGIICVVMAFDMKNDDPIIVLGGAVLIIPLLLLLLGLGLVFIFSPESMEEKLLEGACYRAYGKDTIVPVGKIFVPVHDIVLVEIRCP